MLLVLSKRSVRICRQAFASGSFATEHKKPEEEKPKKDKFTEFNEYVSKPPVKPDPFALYSIIDTRP